MRISLSLIGLVYVVVVGVLCHILPIPEIVKGFLALPVFLIIPYMIGNASFYAIKYFLRIDDETNKISRFIIYWCIGTIVITLLAMFLESINMFNIYSYVGFLGILSMWGVIKDTSKNRLCNKKITHKNKGYTFNRIFPLLLSFLIGIIPAIFISHFSPFPFIYGIDCFHHSFSSGVIINHGHFFLDSSYFPTFHLFISVLTVIFNAHLETMSFFWTARFLTYPACAVGIYLFIYQISKDNKIALLGSFIGVWFMMIVPQYMPLSIHYYFTPKIMVDILFPFFLYLIHKTLIANKKIFMFKSKDLVILLTLPLAYILFLFVIDHWIKQIYDIYSIVILTSILIYIFILKKVTTDTNKTEAFILTVVCLTLFYFHKPMGLLAIMIILLWCFSIWFAQKSKFKSFLIIYLWMLFVLLFFLLQFFDILQFQTIGMRYGGSDENLPVRGYIHFIHSTITSSVISPLFLFLCIGMTYALFFDRQKYLHLSLIFIVFFIFFISFLPVKFMERVFPFVVPFFVYFVSLGIIQLSNMIRKTYKSKLAQPLFITLIIVIVVIVAINPYMSYINKIVSPSNPHFTFYTEKEYDTYRWLGEVTKNRDAIIITDSLTRSLASGISQKDVFGGGVTYKQYVDLSIAEILFTNDSQKAYEQLNFLLTNKTFTCYWYMNSPQTQKCDYNLTGAIIIIAPRTENAYKRLYPEKNLELNLKKFYDSAFFTVLYKDDENKIYIFGVNPEPGVPFKIQN